MKKKEKDESALSIRNGTELSKDVNENAIARFKKKKKKLYTPAEYVDGLLSGNRIILGQAITLVESSLPKHQDIAQEIIEKCLPYAGKSVRIGITGVPGVGKSTFIESLGLYLTKKAHKLAVLAIDPSSDRSKGSILGDKTRMETLSVEPNAFIRPSPSAGSLGGVARKTRESIILCEAAGFDTILVETVGVGQSETAVHSMVDFFLLLMLAGAGDELQGIKRGIMEMADAIAITKADGNNIEKAQRAKSEFANALHLFPPAQSGWTPTVLTCSSRNNTGIEETWNTVEAYLKYVQANGFFEKKRREQAKYWMYETINNTLMNRFYDNEKMKPLLKSFEQKVLKDKISSFNAAKKLLKRFFSK